METTSFASRRPAAGGLPHFQLPPPNPMVDSQVPRTDGLSPLSSGVNSGSSQSSQAGGIAPYNPTGSWPLPGGSSYTYSSLNQGQTGLMQPNYNRQLYSPTGAAYHARSSNSPATGESLAAPPYDSVSPPFPLPTSGGGPAHHSMLSHQTSHHPPPLQNSILSSQGAVSQPPTPSSAAPADSYGRHPPTPGYYTTPSSTPQQSSFPAFSASTLPSPTHHSPTTTGPMSRGIPSLSGQHSPMQPPHYQSRSYGYPLPPAMGGAVLSNMTNPGGQMTIVGGLNHMSHGYPGHIGHMYPHGQAPPQQDRPFKCDVCPQSFNRNHDLKRHKRIHLAVKPFPCNHCDKSFSRKDALKRHRLVKGCGNGKTSPADDSSPQDDVKQDPDLSSNDDIKEEM
ncbi:hypothetical protein JX265_000673 [Neoarthrinium moseri]|uniref:C2H2-type domain-containing protein n=1 Tax=Neoarthrinium moseri TaxID=1658444 RepID=A0A9P9WZ66_9PEZI|nr:hypothetical protein JX266_001405 [Neoarthrinium moseri]KAI1881847.1 hypothetical protein JX265_000673 [Neoarthrinium moseri]